MPLPQLDPITSAISKAQERLATVSSESVSIDQAIGRVLAEPLTADRDSPPLSVSAMDGYAVRIGDVGEKPLLVSSVSYAGRSPVALPEGRAVQIFTGAPVPQGADCVVRREDTQESNGQVHFSISADSLRRGQNIRYQGENIRSGQEVLPVGTEIGPATVAGLATFGSSQVVVRRLLDVSVLTSGDELVPPGETAEPWQIRNSNLFGLNCWLARLPWVRQVGSHQVADTLSASQESLAEAVRTSDAVVLTGGVSAGDTDYFPEAIQSLGGEILFHRLPLRPGKPVLVAMLKEKLIIGLPGNPVSVAVTSRVIAQPLLERLAGRLAGRQVRLPLVNADEKTLNLHWYRLIHLEEGAARLVDSRGSGDLVSLAQSDGFVEVPPGCWGAGPWRAWLW